jgi:hypothetical protein
MEELPFKIVKVHSSGDELIARVDNFEVCKAAFEGAVRLAQRTFGNAPGWAHHPEIERIGAGGRLMINAAEKRGRALDEAQARQFIPVDGTNQ